MKLVMLICVTINCRNVSRFQLPAEIPDTAQQAPWLCWPDAVNIGWRRHVRGAESG